MGLLICAGFEFRDVRLHRVVGKLQLNSIVARAAFFAFPQSQLSCVRHKAAVPGINAFRLFAFLRGCILVMNFLGAAATFERQDFSPRLHSRPLLGQHELAAREVVAGLGEQKRDLQRKHIRWPRRRQPLEGDRPARIDYRVPRRI